MDVLDENISWIDYPNLHAIPVIKMKGDLAKQGRHNAVRVLKDRPKF